MNCPRCYDPVLDERDRDGVVIDVCPQCRGIWLDRGELEKLIARATRDFEEAQYGAHPAAPERRDHAAGPRRYDSDEYEAYDDYGAPAGQGGRDDGHDRRRQPRRRRSWLESLSELFD
jgi:Zn-finger nucleic acid-binding protein